MTPEWKKLQTELQKTAVALLTESRASALALSLEEDRDGYWIAIGPRSQIPFLLGNVGKESPAKQLMHASAGVAPLNHHDLN